MPFMTLAGITVPALAKGVRVQYLQVAGEPRRTITGAPIVEYLGEKRVWDAPTRPMTPAEITALKTAIANQAVVTGNGDFVENTATDVRAWVVDAEYVYDSTAPRRSINVIILED